MEYQFEEGWEENEPTSSVLYDELNIMTGRFASPSALATFKEEEEFSSLFSQSSSTGVEFYLFSPLNMFEYRADIVNNTYEYYLFFPEANIAASTIELEQLFFS